MRRNLITLIQDDMEKGKKAQPSLRPRKIRIKVVGIGGGGASIVSEMASSLKGVSFLVADTDEKVLRKVKRGIRTLQFGQAAAGGMGTGMNPELGKKAALEEKERISRALRGQDLVILIGSLGGGVASGAGPVFAEIARTARHPEPAGEESETLRSAQGDKDGSQGDKDGSQGDKKGRHSVIGAPIIIGIFTLPFSFEGEKKMKIAKKALGELQENLSGVIVVPNEKIFHLVDKKTPLKKSLSALNQAFAGWLNDLIGVISRPGLINVDFADLKTVLSARGKVLFFGQGMAQGPTRAEEAVKSVFQNPFSQGESKQAPLEAVPLTGQVRRILFNIAGGRDLGLKEVETVSNQIAKLNPKAKIIFGISEDPTLQGRIKITLLCSCDSDVALKSEKSEKSEKRKIIKKSKKLRKVTPSKGLAKKSFPTKQPRPARTAPPEPPQEPQDASLKNHLKTRRSAVEVKKEEKEARDREWAQEPEWEIPAFLRKKNL